MVLKNGLQSFYIIDLSFKGHEVDRKSAFMTCNHQQIDLRKMLMIAVIAILHHGNEFGIG